MGKGGYCAADTAAEKKRAHCEVIERALDGLARRFSRQRTTFDPDLFRLRKHRLYQRRLMPAAERRHLDLAAIGAVASGLSAPAAAKSMHWSSSWSPMTRLLGSARTWGRVVNGSY
jgi:hypothetical protein